MDVFNAITTRRAVKRFDPDHRMDEADIERLMSFTVQAPSSFNIQNWRFVLVVDQDMKDRVAAVGFDQPQFRDCSLLVIICADLRAWDRDPERYWSHAPETVRGSIVKMIRGAYADHAARNHDEALRSGGLAAQTLMLAARGLGLDSCPMVGFDFAATGKMIDLPEDHEIVMAVAVGKSLEEPRAWSRLPLDEVVVRERFPKP